jgi:gluconolactonase
MVIQPGIKEASLSTMPWGLIPAWATEATGNRYINARAETVAEQHGGRAARWPSSPLFAPRFETRVGSSFCLTSDETGHLMHLQSPGRPDGEHGLAALSSWHCHSSYAGTVGRLSLWRPSSCTRFLNWRSPMRPFLLVVSLLIGASAFAQDDSAPLPERVEPRLLVRNITFAEGPAFDSKGNLFFVNYKGNGNLGRRTPEGEVEVWLKIPDPAPGRDGKVLHAFPFGLKADAQDRLIAADYGGRRLLRISADKKVETLADSYEGRPFNNPNDVCLDPMGNIYFTDPQGRDKDSVGAIYCFTVAGKLVRLHTGLKYPNGLVVAPDQKTLYVAETWTRCVVGFDLAKDGTLSRQRLIHEFSAPTVDGLAMDEHGRIWVARLDNKTVDVLSPAGKVLASYPVGGDRVTNLAWREKSLYVTVAGKVGAIFRLDVNVRGAP